MSRNLVLIAVVVLLLVVGGWFLMRPKQTVTPAPSGTESMTATESASPEATSGGSMMQSKEVNVSATDFAFSPKVLSVKTGDKVKIVFKNNGKFPHDLKIDDLGVATKVTPAGQSDTIEFTATKTGIFTMYCSVGDHRQKGMEGTVTVE